MQHPFDVESPNRGQLADLVTRVADVDARIRGLQAERTKLLAAAFDLAEREGDRPVLPEPGSMEAELAEAREELARKNETAHAGGAADPAGAEPGAELAPAAGVETRPAAGAENAESTASKTPRRSAVWRDRCHRVVRAEMSAVLRVSEGRVANDITQATHAVTHCSGMVEALSRGEVTEQHVRSVVNAGHVIGHLAAEQLGTTLTDADGAPLDDEAAEREIAHRYEVFDLAVVAHARELTPQQLQPVAKRLAEKLAGVTFDERHRIAKRDRCVKLIERDDGMCEVRALVTTFEAHAVFDRLTQYGKMLQNHDLEAAKSATCTATPAAPVSAAGASEPPAGASELPAAPAATATGTATASTPATPVSAAAAAALKRPLGEARADSLIALLLHGEVDDDELYGPGNSSGKRRGPRVTARVQVLVPVSLTGRLDGAAEQRSAADQPGGTDQSDAAAQPDAGQAFRPEDHEGGFQPELVGVGPIDSDTATRVMHDTPTWDTVIVTDGTTEGATDGTTGNESSGDILSVDTYRVPTHLRRYLAARDPHCRFPGCTLPIYRCDIDHTIAAEHGGPTSLSNTGSLCRGHHVIKHHGGCLVEQGERGEFTWTFPSGREYRTKPPSKVMFRTALESPDAAAIAAENRAKYPFGYDEWDDDPDYRPARSPNRFDPKNREPF